VDGSIQDVKGSGGRATVTVRQEGQMPSPVILEVKLAPGGTRPRATANTRVVDDNTVVVTYPVDVWFRGARTFAAQLDFGARAIERITLDPQSRFPDRDPSDNVWPRK